MISAEEMEIFTKVAIDAGYNNTYQQDQLKLYIISSKRINNKQYMIYNKQSDDTIKTKSDKTKLCNLLKEIYEQSEIGISRHYLLQSKIKQLNITDERFNIVSVISIFQLLIPNLTKDTGILLILKWISEENK